MKTAHVDCTMTAGDTRAFTVLVVDDEGNPLDLTSASAVSTVKYKKTDADAAALWQGSTVIGGVAITNAPAGILTVTQPASATASIAQDVLLYYDVRIVLGDLVTIGTPQAGRILISPPVSDNA